jgi:hypothetical protein
VFVDLILGEVCMTKQNLLGELVGGRPGLDVAHSALLSIEPEEHVLVVAASQWVY